MLAHLEQSVGGVLLEEGACRPLPPGPRRRYLRLHLSQGIKPHGDGAPPDKQAFQLLQIGIAVAALGGAVGTQAGVDETAQDNSES